MNIKKTLTVALFLFCIIGFSSVYAFEVVNNTNISITVTSPVGGFLKHIKSKGSTSWHYRDQSTITLTACWFDRAVCDGGIAKSVTKTFKNDATITVTGICHSKEDCIPSDDVCILKRRDCKGSLTVSG